MSLCLTPTPMRCLLGPPGFTKINANISLKSMTMTIEWTGKTFSVSVSCWAQVDSLRKPDSDDSSDSETESEDESDDDDGVNMASDLCTLTLTNQSMTIANATYPRAYQDFLKLRNSQICHPKVLPAYGTQGPKKKCQCGLE